MGGATQTDRRPDVMNRLAAIPFKDRTTARVFEVMNQVGVQNQGAMYDYVVKSGLVPKEADLYKETKESATQTEVTAPVLELIRSQLPDIAAKIPSVPEAPLGRVTVGAGSAPLTPELLQGLVPELKAAPIPGQPPQAVASLPPAALFGAEAAPALAALPQIPVPGQIIPTTLVTQAAQAATARATTQRFGVDREGVAYWMFGGRPYGDLSPAEAKRVDDYVKAEAIKRLAATGSNRQIDIKDRKYIVDRRTLKPVTKKMETYADFDTETMVYADPKYVEANNSMGKLIPIVSTLDRLSARLNTETDWKAALGRGLALSGGRVFGYEEVAKTYRKELDAWANLMAKHVTQQAGVLTERDTSRMENAFATFFDTKTIRDSKLAIVNRIMAAEQQAILANIRGDIINWADYRVDVDKMLAQLDELKSLSDQAEKEAKALRLQELERLGPPVKK